MKTTVLEGCAIFIEPCPIPQPEGLVEGKQIRIDVLDQAGNCIERLLYPMDPRLAKKVGGNLLGIGQLAVSNGHGIDLRGGQA